jgi:hypothetical protein
MTTAAKFAAAKPPTPDEWAAMADSHLRALRCAYVLANGSTWAMARLPAREMGNVVTELGRAAHFHRVFAELCETAERRLLDASLGLQC